MSSSYFLSAHHAIYEDENLAAFYTNYAVWPESLFAYEKAEKEALMSFFNFIQICIYVWKPHKIRRLNII